MRGYPYDCLLDPVNSPQFLVIQRNINKFARVPLTSLTSVDFAFFSFVLFLSVCVFASVPDSDRSWCVSVKHIVGLIVA